MVLCNKPSDNSSLPARMAILYWDFYLISFYILILVKLSFSGLNSLKGQFVVVFAVVVLRLYGLDIIT